ncbi:ABC transporter permease [Actinocrispum wychmicini]|uniref:Peptide/nickel transport system permease protein n=1 Tax=Actinocrispum wychmicini TaxID=1213861 RepID=A0A4R2JV47_9PSEU|nr:ABC transporter permease [Actinocrispum wychmicini]TCO60919.1 peptide/nickel transport system permease protein [Actinocrispum wychmicini]
MTSPVWARRRAAAGKVWRAFTANRGGLIGLGVLALFVLTAIFIPLLIDDSALDVTRATGGRLKPPSGEYLLGTDENGRSVLALTLWGTRVSLVVGLAATLLAVVIGTLVGILVAHFGRWVSAILLPITDFFLVLPSLVLAIALSAVLDGGVGTIILAIGVVSWPTGARLVRAQTLAVEARPYIERAKALGGGHTHVIVKHVLPSVLPLVFVNTTLAVGSAIVAESTLSFLGLGDPNNVTWGSILHAANASGAITYGAWWYLLPPGISIALVVLSFTMVGRSLETVLNPKLREQR